MVECSVCDPVGFNGLQMLQTAKIPSGVGKEYMD